MSDTQNPGGWPDAERPGVPLEPERDGLHYITDAVALWNAGRQKWTLLFRARQERPEWLAAQPWAEYRGPCPTAEELAARVEAARRKGIEAAAQISRLVVLPEDCSAGEAHGRMMSALTITEGIRALLEDGR